MKFSEDSNQAAEFVRQAIPAMVKHKVVPNPLNYTLWYSYFSNQFPELNKELEQAIERYGTCPQKVSETLFIRHVSQLDSDQSDAIEDFQNIFASMVSKLSETLDETAQQTNQHTAALRKNIGFLEAQDLDDSVLPVLSEMNQNASAICGATDSFQEQLTAAQNEIVSLRAKLEESNKEANTDPLTGLYNRRFFETIYSRFIAENNDAAELSLIIMDIDKFKVFNDTHGHILGDQILTFVGDLLLRECPKNVTPVRFGGEEFAMFCPGFGLQNASDIAEKIRGQLQAIPFKSKKTGQKIPPVTASFGVALKQSSEEFVEIIERADKALYQAKESGRNRVVLAD